MGNVNIRNISLMLYTTVNNYIHYKVKYTDLELNRTNVLYKKNGHICLFEIKVMLCNMCKNEETICHHYTLLDQRNSPKRN